MARGLGVREFRFSFRLDFRGELPSSAPAPFLVAPVEVQTGPKHAAVALFVETPIAPAIRAPWIDVRSDAAPRRAAPASFDSYLLSPLLAAPAPVPWETATAAAPPRPRSAPDAGTAPPAPALAPTWLDIRFDLAPRKPLAAPPGDAQPISPLLAAPVPVPWEPPPAIGGRPRLSPALAEASPPSAPTAPPQGWGQPADPAPRARRSSASDAPDIFAPPVAPPPPIGWVSDVATPSRRPAPSPTFSEAPPIRVSVAFQAWPGDSFAAPRRQAASASPEAIFAPPPVQLPPIAWTSDFQPPVRARLGASEAASPPIAPFAATWGWVAETSIASPARKAPAIEPPVLIWSPIAYTVNAPWGWDRPNEIGRRPAASAVSEGSAPPVGPLAAPWGWLQGPEAPARQRAPQAAPETFPLAIPVKATSTWGWALEATIATASRRAPSPESPLTPFPIAAAVLVAPWIETPAFDAPRPRKASRAEAETPLVSRAAAPWGWAADLAGATLRPRLARADAETPPTGPAPIAWGWQSEAPLGSAARRAASFDFAPAVRPSVAPPSLAWFGDDNFVVPARRPAPAAFDAQVIWFPSYPWNFPPLRSAFIAIEAANASTASEAANLTSATEAANATQFVQAPSASSVTIGSTVVVSQSAPAVAVVETTNSISAASPANAEPASELANPGSVALPAPATVAAPSQSTTIKV